MNANPSTTSAQGKKGLSVGERCTGPEGAPAFSGRAEYVSEGSYDALLLIDKPAPGVAALGTFNMGGDNSMVLVGFHLYGDQAAEIAARETPIWQTWFQERFPAPTKEK